MTPKHFICLIISLTLITPTFADHLQKNKKMKDIWSQEMRSHLKTYHNPYQDAFLSTIMGVCGFSWPWKKKHGQYKDDGYGDRTLEERIPYTIVKSYSKGIIVGKKAGKKKTKKAPLLIFLPGMFNEHDDDQNDRFLYDMSKRGHHVAVFPNPLSTDFIKAKPTYKPGAFLKEAKTLYGAIKMGIKSFKRQGLLQNDEVRLVGVSYGGLMASIITALDADDENLITKGSTLISPPLDFQSALGRLDTYINDTSKDFSAMKLHNKMYRFLKICFSGEFESRLDWAKGVTIYAGFQEYLVNSIKTWRKIQGIKDQPFQDPKWERTFNFAKYIEWYAPELEAMLHSPEAKLKYWVDRSLVLGKKIRILAAEDDWLNVPIDWADFHQAQVILLPNGGHYGFRSLDWFTRFLTIAFPVI